MILFVTTFTFLNLNNSAYATGYEGKSKFIGVDEETVNLKTSVKITDNTVNYITNITFVVHGINSSASAWSNNLGTQYGKSSSTSSGVFGYNPNSIIECLRRRSDANIYLIEADQDAELTYMGTDSYLNKGFYLKKLIVDKSTDEYHSTDEYYVKKLMMFLSI